MLRKAALFWLPFLLLAAQGLSPGRLPAQARENIRDQWGNSPHARSMDTPEERERMNRAGCAHCHTAEGYHQVILAGEESTAPYPDVTGLTCVACHNGDGESVEAVASHLVGAAHQAGASDQVGALRAGAASDACRGCHDELVSNQPDDLSWCSQFGIFEGMGGMEAGEKSPAASAHSALDGGCVACHMAPAGPGADPLLVGGHTFRVKTKGDLTPAFNSGPCTPCHGEMTADGLAESQAEVRELLGALAELLPLNPTPEDPHQTEPRYPADPSLTPVQKRASHNYWLVQKDGSFGVHNPKYTRALLQGSIEELLEARGDRSQEIAEELAVEIDHVIWAVPSLDEGVSLFKEMSGAEAVTGGAHPGRGTRNSLASAGENRYLEIIAPDPEQMPFDPEANPVQAFAHEISRLASPEVDMFAVSAPDLEAVAERGRELGLQVVGPSPGQRRTPDGTLIRWSHVDFIGHDFGQFLPFALNWLDSPHPSTTSPKGAEIVGITVEHPRAEELGELYRGLGIPATVVFAEEPRILVQMRGPKGPFELTSGKSLLAYYASRAVKNIK